MMNFLQYVTSIAVSLFTLVAILVLLEPTLVGKWRAEMDNAYFAALTLDDCNYIPPGE